MNFSTSRGRKPPGSGQPVPGTNAASRQSTSKLSQTASAPSHATSRARCGRLLDAHLDAVGHGHDGGLAFAADLHARPGRLPAADTDLHEVLRRHVRDVRGVEPGRRVHALVEVGLLRVDVAVEVDDAEVPAVEVLRHTSHGREADRVVAAEHDRERAARVDVARRPCVIWSNVFSMFAGMVKMSPRSHDRDRFTQVDAELEAVRRRRARRSCGCPAARSACRSDRSYRRRTARRGSRRRTRRSGARPRGRAPSEKGVDAGEVRQLAAAERRDALVDDGVGARQAELEAARDLLLPLRRRYERFASTAYLASGP